MHKLNSSYIKIGIIAFIVLAILAGIAAAGFLIFQQIRINAAITQEKHELYQQYNPIYTELISQDVKTKEGNTKFIELSKTAATAQTQVADTVVYLDSKPWEMAYAQIAESKTDLEAYNQFQNCINSFKPKYTASLSEVEKYYVHYAVASGNGNYSTFINRLNTLKDRIDKHVKLLKDFKACFKTENDYLKYFDSEMNSMSKYRNEFVVPAIPVFKTGSQVKIQTFLNSKTNLVTIYVDNLYKKGEFTKGLENLYQEFTTSLDKVKLNHQQITKDL